MMMNKYGYFKYSDFAVGAKENASYSINKELQEGSALTQLSVGVEPYNFASLELNSYITSQPKLLYKMQQNLGLLTADVSNENGVFEEPIVLTVNFPAYFSMTGITINSRNIIKKITITAYQNDTQIVSETYSTTTNENFYPINIELANKIVFTVTEIDKPYHFFGIFNIEYGKIRFFNDETSVNVEITNNFSVLSDTLEYDTLDLTVIDSEKEDYLFQRKQPIDFVVDKTSKARFFVDSGTELDDNTVQLLAYDEIASLEDNFYGGIYENYPFDTLISDILSGTNINFSTENTNNILLSGYLPISSRRKALQTVLQGSNIRCYKGEKLVFKPLEMQISDIVFDETNILNKPQKNKKQEIRSLTVKQHNYSKGTEETELYSWYISSTENNLITFPTPIHELKAYEIVGADEYNDIISETESKDLEFIEKKPNYCVVRNNIDTNNNLFFGEIEQGGISSTIGGENYETNERIRFKNFLSIESGQYKVSASQPCIFFVYVYDENENFLAEESLFKTSDEALYLDFPIRSNRKIKVVMKYKEDKAIVPSDISDLKITKNNVKFLIVGKKYVDSTTDYVNRNSLILSNNNYEEKIIELTISSNPQEVCNLLYDLHSRKNSIKFNTFFDVEMGGCYSILGEVLNIKSKHQTMNGIYEVEAV